MLRAVVCGGLIGGWLAAVPASVLAQSPLPPPNAPPVSAPGTATIHRWPVPPEPFQRGNVVPQRPDHPQLQVRHAPEIGFYFAPFKFVSVLLLLAAWVHLSAWVHGDSQGLRLNGEWWNLLTLGGGLAGTALVLSLPLFPLGVAGLFASVAAPVGWYVVERNGHVPENRRVLTSDHLKSWSRRQLARLGIRLGGDDDHAGGGSAPIVFIGKTRTGQRDETRTRQVESSKGYVAAKELVYDAIIRRATDIHLEPRDSELAVRLRIDGVMYPAEPFDRSTGDALINIFKVLCAMDITERRRPQDGSFGALLEGREIDFRAASQGARHGEKLSLRILDQTHSVSRLAQLGMRKQMLEKIQQVINQPHGMFLVSGPTGAGKSTTLYAALGELNATQRNIITIEDPIEYKMDQLTQIEINSKAGSTFGQALRSVLRQDPDVVMIGEIRDEETAKIACQSANTGHMVFSTVHANDSIAALFRLIDLGVEPFMLSSAISAILAQRLARRLCPHCRRAYQPSAELLQAVGIPPDKVKEFYRPPPEGTACAECSGLGYLGRIGVFELLSINDRMRDMIRDRASLTSIRNEARKDGMLYMQEEGLRLVIRGLTSVDEIRRVVQ